MINIELLKSLDIELSVEIGRKFLQISEVLNLSKGSIIELDILITEPVKIYAGGQLIALGEVVVIDDKFCVRIKEILKKDRKN